MKFHHRKNGILLIVILILSQISISYAQTSTEDLPVWRKRVESGINIFMPMRATFTEKGQVGDNINPVSFDQTSRVRSANFSKFLGIYTSLWYPIVNIDRETRITVNIGECASTYMWHFVPYELGYWGETDVSELSTVFGFPFGVDLRFGKEGKPEGNNHLSSVLGVGLMPYFSMTFGSASYIMIGKSIAPFAKMDFGIFTSFMNLKIRGTVFLKNMNLGDTKSNFLAFRGHSDDGRFASLKGSPSFMLSLIWMPKHYGESGWQ